MYQFYRIPLLLLITIIMPLARAGLIVEVQDPRYFAQKHEVIFPASEIKLVTTQFESSENDEHARSWTKKLHDRTLAGIHDLHGGAIVTYVLPEGENILNYREESEKIAKEQNAQMVLWGRVLQDKKGTAYIKARLNLITPPPGIDTEYKANPNVYTTQHGGATVPMFVKGVVNAPVTQRYIEFKSYENDITPVAYFLSGLMRYYKGAVRKGTPSIRWLESSIDDFSQFIELTSTNVDNATLAQAQLYTARAYLRLALTDQGDTIKKQNLKQASKYIENAARYNPYDPDIPMTMAVIETLNEKEPAVIHNLITRAVKLAPVNSDAWINLAIMNTAQGRISIAKNNLDTAELILSKTQAQPSDLILKLRKQLEQQRDLPKPSGGLDSE